MITRSQGSGQRHDHRQLMGRVGHVITQVRAHNPGPLTLDGTNSYLIGADAPIVVDPGPPLPGHLAALAAHDTPRLVLLTHRHLDHSGSAGDVAQRWGCPVRAADPALCVDAAPLADGEIIEAEDLVAEVVATPGHSADSVCFLVGDELIAGDTVLGRGTTVLAEPDGDLGDYLDSLDRLITLVAARNVRILWPGHGPAVTDPAERVDAYRRHRLDRLAQVRSALAAGLDTVAEILAAVYPDLDPALVPAARQSVAAQLRYLAGGGGIGVGLRAEPLDPSLPGLSWTSPPEARDL